jgi:hypothetical protein
MESNVQSVFNYSIAKMYVKKIVYDKISYYVKLLFNYPYTQC